MMNGLNSPEPEAQVSFSDRLLSVLRLQIFISLTSSPDPGLILNRLGPTLKYCLFPLSDSAL
jgi:hypothetical protein